MITVKVVYKSSGKPAEGKKVALGKDGLLTGGVTHGKWTNSRGEAHFDTSSGHGKVFVSGSTEYEGELSGRIVVYI